MFIVVIVGVTRLSHMFIVVIVAVTRYQICL